MRLNLYASLEHYAEHLWPIWQALPERLRGASWSSATGKWWGEPLGGLSDARQHPGPVLVASHGDAVSATVRGRDLVYVEHGAGQTYGGDPAGAGAAGLSGSTDRAMRHVLLFVCPNTTVASRWRRLYDVPAVAVGCPKLDEYHPVRPKNLSRDRTVVAVTFHWDSSLLPETMTAWPEYDGALPVLRDWCIDHDMDLVGHGHPRIWPRIERRWAQLGVERIPLLAEVFDHADVLVADNTSALPEFASLGRPVVWLNASGYRRDVHHGGRFWEWPEGQVQCDHPGELTSAVARALEDPPAVRAARARMVRAVYGETDGQAAQRAADAIAAIL